MTLREEIERKYPNGKLTVLGRLFEFAALSIVALEDVAESQTAPNYARVAARESLAKLDEVF